MADARSDAFVHVARQVTHWTEAADRLEALDDLASSSAWGGLEAYLGVAVRRHLAEVVAGLRREATVLRSLLATVTSASDVDAVRRQLHAFRNRYLRVETTLDFFATAIGSRTSPAVAAFMRACDTLAYRSMAHVLDPLSKPTPVVLTYLDKGLGASILRAGLRLWDATSVNPVAAIKITRHNLHRPTALIHEAGHQVAHVLGWNDELAAAYRANLASRHGDLADLWAGWASEIAADAFAFAHTGYASVASLHDVLDGGDAIVYRYGERDPHPISFLRVLLGVEMCRAAYGAGPWDDLAASWTRAYPIERAPEPAASVIRSALATLPEVASVTLHTPMAAFGGARLVDRVDPARVAPNQLVAMEQRLGGALHTSMHWVWTEALRLLALSGLRIATGAGRSTAGTEHQTAWMLRLGGAVQAA